MSRNLTERNGWVRTPWFSYFDKMFCFDSQHILTLRLLNIIIARNVCLQIFCRSHYSPPHDHWSHCPGMTETMTLHDMSRHVTHYTWRTQLRTDGELPLDFDISAKTKTGGHLPGKYQSFLAWRKSLLRGLQSLQLPSLDSWQRMQIDSKPVIPLVIILIRPGLSNSKHRVSLHYWAVRRINHRINTEKRVRSKPVQIQIFSTKRASAVRMIPQFCRNKDLGRKLIFYLVREQI